MVRVALLDGATDEKVGDFDFDELPRKGEEITVPWPQDPHGVRIFTVEDVWHIAAGVTEMPGIGSGPLTVIRGDEIG